MADVSESVLAAPIGAGSIEKGTGANFAVYTATKAGATDTVTVDAVSTVYAVLATNDGTGALDPVTDITNNVITLSVGTGATTLWVWGK